MLLVRIIALAFAVFAAAELAAKQSRPGPLHLNSSTAVRELGYHASYLVDDTGGLTMTEAGELHREGRFLPVGEAHFDLGYSNDVAWIVVELINDSATDATYILSTNIPYVPSIDMYYQESDGIPQQLLRKRPDTAYSNDQFTGLSVVSAQFLVDAGERGRLLVRFQPYGIGILPLSLETPASLFQAVQRDMVGFAAFYAFAITALALFVLFIVALRNSGGLYFVVLFTLSLLLIAQIDGFLNAYLWPDYPRWNLVASFPLLLATCTASFATARYMVRTASKPRGSAVMAPLSIACLTPLALTPLVEVIWLIPLGFVLLLLSMAALFYGSIVWARDVPAQHILAVFISLAMFLVIGGTVYFVVAGSSIVSSQSHLFVKTLYAGGSTVIMVSFATHLTALERNYRASLARELEAVKRDAELNAGLLASERKYARARDIAAKRQHQLAAASHDLRQPISSLRLTLDGIAGESDMDVKQNVAQAFDYLEQLVTRHMSAAKSDHDILPHHELDETFSAGLVVDTVAEMFQEEAISKGLKLKRVDSTLETTAGPVAVMRIVSNLVSNAVKYTDRGKVLVGCRRTHGEVHIDILDTGEGMTREELELFCGRNSKGPSSSGDGLGVAICFELAHQHGYGLDVKSVKGRGTRFRLSLARVP